MSCTAGPVSVKSALEFLLLIIKIFKQWVFRFLIWTHNSALVGKQDLERKWKEEVILVKFSLDSNQGRKGRFDAFLAIGAV